MTDFENKDLNGQPAEPAEQPAPQPAEPVGVQPDQPTPQLTLEPEPAVPDIPVPETGAASAQDFHMPEPPCEEPPQYSAPQYGAPQYGAPQYGAQQPQQNYQPGYYQQPQAQYSKPLYNVPPAGYVQKSRIAAGLLAILFGVFGVHNYYLGFNSRATIQLVVSLAGGLLTCGIATAAMAIWGLVEGVLILSANSPKRMYDGNGVILRD